MQALDALLNRVSVPRLLEPAPTQEQRDVLFAAAMRAPDHGQLRPWRFLTVEGAAREQMGTLLAEAARLQDADAPHNFSQSQGSRQGFAELHDNLTPYLPWR